MARAADVRGQVEPAAVPARRLWTRDEFHRAAEAGLFAPDERLELVGGEIIEKMTPQKSPHATAISLVADALRQMFGREYHVRVQLPLALRADSEPEPDVAVVLGSPRDYELEHPASAVLVVEVADVTLTFDRRVKASLYASVTVPEYWIVNLQDRVVEQHRDPISAPDEQFGFRYRAVTRLTESDSITCLSAPEATIQVSELLPRRRASRSG